MKLPAAKHGIVCVMPEIRRPSIDQAAALSAIAFDSKAHWGYSREFMEQCRSELTVTKDAIESGMVEIAVVDQKTAGFYKLAGGPPTGELDMLFVHPDYMGLGLGRLLIEAAKTRAASLLMKDLVIDSDPNAEQFYLHMGAIKVGETPSESIPGRVLPKLLLHL